MRSALYAALSAHYPTYHGSYSGKVGKKPYLFLFMEAEVRTRLKSFTPFSIYVYADAGDLRALDAACEAVIGVLRKKTFERVKDSSTFFVEYSGCGADFVDDEKKAVARQLRFFIPIFGKDFL